MEPMNEKMIFSAKTDYCKVYNFVIWLNTILLQYHYRRNKFACTDTFSIKKNCNISSNIIDLTVFHLLSWTRTNI